MAPRSRPASASSRRRSSRFISRNRAVPPKLAPFILIISNDPEIPTVDVLKAPDAGEGELFTDLSAPAKTILNTRAARGTLAVEGVVTSLAQVLPDACVPYAAHVRVW